nr:WYL domain-containing protein [Dissulfurirhabdus thermomarina]
MERIYEFHHQVRKGRYPNARSLADQFEVSLSTARRDIDYLRDRLLAPLAFDRVRNGYRYEGGGFRLPFDDTQRVLLFLALLERMAEETGLSCLEEVQRLRRRLGTLLQRDQAHLLERLHCEFVEVEPADPEVMDRVLTALLEDRPLAIRYADPKGRRTERVIEPHLLITYQGRWYTLARCRLRDEMRIFLLSRITEARPEKGRFAPDIEAARALLGKSFGIFKGPPRHRARVRFTGDAAEVVRRQRWHQDQVLEDTGDGGAVVLTVPVAPDYTEFLMKVLQFGARAEVLEPPEIRAAAAREAAALARVYGGGGGRA